MRLSESELRSRGAAFRELHDGPEPFVIPNPWNAGTARILAGLGFPALATTSAGLAVSLGLPDGANLLDRETVLANAHEIVTATPLPVSADLESGFAETPEGVAGTVRAAADAGLVGGSIEDATGLPGDPVRPLAEAVDRVTAAVEAARGLPFPFTVTARAENFLYGRPDLDDTIRRLQAYEEAGADVLYAPGLPSADAVRAVCTSVGRPVNALAGSQQPALDVAALAACGVRRISLGSTLSRAALGGFVRAAREVLDHGTFGFVAQAPPYGDVNQWMTHG
ncbi:isocitrate lyase/PEP mutase family protein [Streptomyces brevispora]|uniref:Isocitrate lyase/phosphoenolpyruvate mutase family protein n=1 Tax=Streptomyces brevispora TaxID=887462 RepID=A0ABZ1G781_9ACTN|nr:isocitrate lyase/phosphoenolpyruvate mutase family protein [Streptomyces brevispora]WSC14538.1 isocitrate lyase/phosphoenolpyruvate mutase family protein [Streptomyces brevispora]